MKSLTKAFTILLFAALPISLLGQNPTVIIAYMKVTPGYQSEYLEVEQAWKKIHQKAIETKVHNGWQLWRKLHVGTNDPYDYMTIQWYDNYEHTFGEDAPEGWMEEVYSEEEWAELYEKTQAARTYVCEEVSRQVISADNAKGLKYLIVSRMKVKPGMVSEYLKMEEEIFKPLFEEAINRDFRAHWGIWNTWPFKNGQATYTAVNGYANAKQFTSPGVDLLPDVHPDKTWEEIQKMIFKTRENTSTEVWELVDFVVPAE